MKKILLFTLLLYSGAAVSAETIKLVIPFIAGGTTDIIGRVIAQGLQKNLSDSVVVELKPGASGIIGAEYVAKSKPNGYTILLGTRSLAANASLTKLNFDPAAALVGITGIGSIPYVILVGSKSRFNSLTELIDYAKAHPDELTFGSSGIRTAGHLSEEIFKSTTGIKMRHIPYNVTSMYPDLISLRIDALFELEPATLPNIVGGLTRPLAITSVKRSSILPDVPTVAELGFPGYENGSWMGLLVPFDTPRHIIEKLGVAGAKALQDKEVIQKLSQLGVQPIPSSQVEFSKFYLDDIKYWTKMLSEGKLGNLE